MLCKPEKNGFRRTSPLPVALPIHCGCSGIGMILMPVFLSFDIGFRHWYDVVGAGAEGELFLREYL